MKLTDLLRYNDIVIQCHDKPDADTIASGYALLKYLEKQGKFPRLVYAGAQKLTRGSLDAMKNKFNIPLEYQAGPKEGEEAELLVTVDCRAGENNVSPLPHQNLAVIDHHSVKAEETLPELHEVRTEADGYASCATVLWAMLKEAGYPIEEDDQLPTILYYGLYMDTQELKTARKMDKEMLESLKYDTDIVAELQSVNLSLKELQIMGRAYNSLHINSRYCFAVAQAEPCDPDILGIVGDELMKVAGVNVSVAYSMLDGYVKISVRCRRRRSKAAGQDGNVSDREVSAAELVSWLVWDMGNDGGGAPTKAAGRIPKEFLEDKCAEDDWDDLSGATGRLIYKRLTAYFDMRPEELRTGEYSLEKVREFCVSEAALYRKKKVPVGYVKATDLFPEGEDILIRMLEGDVRKKVTSELYIMIGVNGEIYHSEESKLRKNYDLTDDPFPIDGGSPWQPKIYRYVDREVKLLAPYAKICVARDGAIIRAAQLGCRLKVLTVWDEWHLGEVGDWLASREDDCQDVYIIQKAIFEQTYERVAEVGFK